MRESDGEPERRQREDTGNKARKGGAGPTEYTRAFACLFLGLFWGLRIKIAKEMRRRTTPFSKVLLEWEDKMLKIIWHKLRVYFPLSFCGFSRYKLEIKSLLVTFFFSVTQLFL